MPRSHRFERLEREHSLKAEPDSAFAAPPLMLLRTSVLEDPSGEPL
jgi:hypothetical protein